MDDTPTPRNRRERRAAAKANGTDFVPNKPSHLDAKLKEIPLAKPDFDAPRKPGHKTLYELAEERQKQLQKEGFYDKDKNNTYGEDGGDHQFWSSAVDGDPIGPLGEAFVWTTSLGMIHFTLDVLVFHQYRQSIEWGEIWMRTFKMIPALFVVIYMLHTRMAKRLGMLRQLFFLGVSVAAGCYLLKSGNQDGYYYVMKKAPPVGTLWIWSCVEMDLVFAIAHVVAVGGYMWWNGFKAF